jgi:3-oxoadipate enol-lactonase
VRTPSSHSASEPTGRLVLADGPVGPDSRVAPDGNLKTGRCDCEIVSGVNATPIQAQAAGGAVVRGSMWESGRAERVVLVHSLALDRTVWRFIVQELSERMDVIAVDCRGHGASDHVDGPYTVELMADDLAAVMEAAGWTRAVLAGCSMGGCVAQAFAVHHPQRTAGLVLIDTTAWYGPTAPADWAGRAQRARDGGLASLRDFQVTRWFGDAFVAANDKVVEDLMDRFVANDLNCYEATCEMLGAADLRAQIGSYRGPAAVLVGADDDATPAAMAEDLGRRIGAPAPTVLPDARHLTPLECPQQIASAITAIAVAVGSDGP